MIVDINYANHNLKIRENHGHQKAHIGSSIMTLIINSKIMNSSCLTFDLITVLQIKLIMKILTDNKRAAVGFDCHQLAVNYLSRMK